MFIFQVLLQEKSAVSVWNSGIEKMQEKISKDPQAQKEFNRWERIGGNFIGVMVGGEKGEKISKNFGIAKVEGKDEEKFNGIYLGFKKDLKFMESVFLSYKKKLTAFCEKEGLNISESKINEAATNFTEQMLLFTSYSMIYASGMGINSESAMVSMNTSFDLFDLFMEKVAKNKQIASLGLENMVLSQLLKLDDVLKVEVLDIINKNKQSIKELGETKRTFNRNFAQNNFDLANHLEKVTMPSILYSLGGVQREDQSVRAAELGFISNTHIQIQIDRKRVDDDQKIRKTIDRLIEKKKNEKT